MVNFVADLILAIALDIFGILCLLLSALGPVGAFLGESLSFIPDIIGFVFLSHFSFKRMKGKKFLLAFIGELVQFVGALPFWTFFVLSDYVLSKSKK